MKHSHPSTSSVSRSGGMALLRLVAALAVMLLAVLPHATLAASVFHDAAPAMPGMAKSHGMKPAHDMTPARHTGHQTDEPTPCHEDEAGKAGPSMPSCCILGCGLLGFPPAGVVMAEAMPWRRVAPSLRLPFAKAAPEPAERPPRRMAPAV